MRLIDADELRKEIDKQAYPHSDSTANDIYFSVLHLLADAPTVDAEPVWHGKWQSMNERNEIYGDVYMCDNCGHGFIICESFNYCPNCGAKMDGE